jgi:hypothetical protein
MTTEAILTELRAVPGAPERLRDRVRELPEPPARLTWTLPRIDLRRSVLVLAPAIVVFAVGAAALHGLISGTAAHPSARQAVEHAGRAQTGAYAGGGGASRPATLAPDVRAPARPSFAPGASTALARGAAVLPPSTTRLNEYDAWLRVRVDDARLADATTDAMKIARAYGGYVASVDMNTPGRRGAASLVLRIPVTKVEDAVLRLGALGDVTAQRVRIEDLQRQANALERRIEFLGATIAKLERRLADPTLAPDDRLRLRYRLDDARRELAQKTKARAAVVRTGTLATVSLSLFTPQPATAVPHERGRLDAAAHDAGSFLVRELSWLVYFVVAAGPIALLAAVVVLALRSARRRGERRLLEGA